MTRIREEAQKRKYRNITFPRFSLQGPHTKFFFLSFCLQLLLETVLFAKNAKAAKSYGPSKANMFKMEMESQCRRKAEQSIQNFSSGCCYIVGKAEQAKVTVNRLHSQIKDLNYIKYIKTIRKVIIFQTF